MREAGVRTFGHLHSIGVAKLARPSAARPVMWPRRSGDARTAKNGRSKWSAISTAGPPRPHGSPIARTSFLSPAQSSEPTKADKNGPPLSDVIDRYIAESEKAIGKTKAQVQRSIKKDTLGSKACSGQRRGICDFAKGRAWGIGYSLWPRWDQRRLHARSRDGARRTARRSGAESPGRPASYR